MRIKRIHIVILIFVTFFNIESAAQTFEQIHLNDGSVLEGYICEQIPGKSVSVQASKATLVANSDSLLSSNERMVAVTDLPSEWKKWVMAQPTSLNQVALSDLKFKNVEYKDVLITENGPTIQFISLSNKAYTLPWSKVSKTVKMQRPEGVVSGIDLKQVLLSREQAG